MLPSDEGFLYPHINHDICIKCNLCQKKCPILNPVKHHEAPKVYASWSLSDQVRTSSSSGGMFSEISNWAIQHNGVIFGVVIDDKLDAVHKSARTMDEYLAMKGSKYFQSNTKQTFKDVKSILNKDQHVIYTGTPCQIAGLLKYLSPKTYDKLITVDIVCHGVPSVLVFKDYLKKLSKYYPNIDYSSFQFRKLNGWGLESSIKSNNERVNIKSRHDIFVKLFLNGYLHREACYNCVYTTTHRVADITIADFWGIGKQVKFNHDTSKGVSLTLINTSKGERLLNEIKDNVFVEEREIEEALVVNDQLYRPSKYPKWGREMVYKYFLCYSIDRITWRFFGKHIIKVTIINILVKLHLRKEKHY